MASRFPSAWLEDLRARCDLAEIVSGYVVLKKNGRKYWGLCPFHHEKTASFSVDPEKQLYYCFGCKAGGTVFNFIMDSERLSFHEAVAFLADRAHVQLPQMEYDADYEQRRSQNERLFNANLIAARYYNSTLYSPEGAPVLEYFHKRGLSDAIIRKFGLGASPDKPDALTAKLLDAGFSEKECVLSGLTKESDDHRLRDFFRGRAMFPIINQYDHVLAFGGRALKGDSGPKYLNSPDTPVYNKRSCVFAANLIKRHKNLSRVILVEGYMDVVSLTQFGIDGVCATLGTALTTEQARLIHRYAPCVHLAYDGDAAGQHAILRGLDILKEASVPSRVLDFPEGLDPDEFVRKYGAEAFNSLPSLSPETYRIRRLSDDFDLADAEGRTQYARECAKILKGLDPVELEQHIEALSVKTGFPREVLLDQIDATPSAATAQKPLSRVRRNRIDTDESRHIEGADRAQETLLALAATGRLPASAVSADDFSDPFYRTLASGLASGASPSSLIDDQTDENMRSLLTRIMMIPLPDDTDMMLTMVKDCVTVIRRASIEKQRNEILESISQYTSEEKASKLAEVQELSARLSELRRLGKENASCQNPR